MKRIELPNIASEGGVAKILYAVLEYAPKGADIAEQRRRFRIIEKVEELDDSRVLDLEDADYNHLKQLYSVFPFSVARRDFLTIADAINDAQKPPPPAKVESADAD